MIVGYVRLSRDDDKKNYISIENQKLIIEQYAISQGLSISRWYEDDGYSGYKFDRPAFTNLLTDLKKDVDTIIAKDLSRIGRHNAKVLLLLEDFKENGTRLLLVDDNYDTLKDEDDMIGIKTWYNERYVKDTSKKIKRVIKAHQTQGTLITKVPFGYSRSQEDKSKIEIIETEAVYIRSIFNYYLQGYGYRNIAYLLTEQKVPTPSTLIKGRKTNQNSIPSFISNKQWSEHMVSAILKNDFYIGILRLHKRERITINGVDHRVPKEEHLIFEHNHQPIIDMETFYKVNDNMKQRIRTCSTNRKEDNSLFRGYLYCKDCNHQLTPIIRSNDPEKKYYICSTYNRKGKQYCNHPHLIHESDLIQDIITYLQFCRNILMEEIKTYKISDISNINLDIRRKEQLLNDIISKKKQLKILIGQKLADLSLSADNHETINECYGSLQEDIIENIAQANKEIKELEISILEQKEKAQTQYSALQILDMMIESKTVNRNDIPVLIDRIIVDQNGLPEIIVNHTLDYPLDMTYKAQLNRSGYKLFITILTIIYGESRDYTSTKYLIKQLSAIGYHMTNKTIIPYIGLCIDNGILKSTDNKQKPYLIPFSKEELADKIKFYIKLLPTRWNASDGI